jgi:flagellar biosynthesis/type III secretory pathway chaperone
MDTRIKLNLYKQKDLLADLADKLSEQYALLISGDKDVVAICSMADKVDALAKSIAVAEIERRKLISNEELIKQIESNDEPEFKALLKELSHLKRVIENQNDLNSNFVKQNLFFTNKMLKMITPNDRYDTYNNSGKLK